MVPVGPRVAPFARERACGMYRGVAYPVVCDGRWLVPPLDARAIRMTSSKDAPEGLPPEPGLHRHYF
eukprot:7257583-Alexandrium_andersonii.AAC.1